MRGITLTLLALFALSATAAQAGDANRGKITFMRQCSACHTVIANTRDSMGPNLFGVVGRQAGSKRGYTYSDAMKGSGIVWSETALKSYVMDPMGVVPQSNMMFTGTHNPAQADDVVAYLATLK